MGDEQLHLGEGIVGEVVDFIDHAVQVPMDLILDPEVSGQALATYTVMKSFGRRAEASLKSYAERLGWEPETVKRWQQVLVKAGWMVLLKEGVGGEIGTPRLWWMAKVKEEQPPLGAFLNAPPTKKQPTQKHPSKQGLSKRSKLQSKTPAADAGPFKAADGTHWVDLMADYVQAYREAKQEPTANPEISPADGAQLKRLAKDGRFNRELFQKRLANMKHHDFHAQQEFSLTYFCSRFREFDDNAERVKRAKTGGRPGAYKPVTDIEDFGG